MAKLEKFSEVAQDGCCPKCGYAVMKRGANAVYQQSCSRHGGNARYWRDTWSSSQEDHVRRMRNQVPAGLTSRQLRTLTGTAETWDMCGMPSGQAWLA
jgi:hypothetical protein